MASVYETVGKRISALRKVRGWTQERLAEEVGRNPSYLARIESGKRSATIDTLCMIAGALEEPIAALFSDQGEQDDLPAEFRSALRGLARDDLLILAKVARRFERSESTPTHVSSKGARKHPTSKSKSRLSR